MISRGHTPQTALLCCRALTSSRLRLDLMSKKWALELGRQELRQHLYLSNHGWQSRLPDHVFDFGFQAAQDEGLRDGMLARTSLRLLAERYLEVPHGSVHAKLEHFGEWQQSVLSRISALPIVAARQALHRAKGGYLSTVSVETIVPERTNHPSLPCITPLDPAIEHYIRNQGVHESHLHLNGSTFAEQCWLRALERPDQEVKAFSTLWQQNRRSPLSDKIHELAYLHDQSFEPTQLKRDLYLARNLRSWLVFAACANWSQAIRLPKGAQDLHSRVPTASLPAIAVEYELSRKSPSEQMVYELDWMTKLLGKLFNESLPTAIDRMFHLYLLLQHQYRQLMVQGEELYGFDQFQKYTYTELRSEAESNYVQRLIDMHGPYDAFSQTGFVEGRFAPKGESLKNVELLQRILGAYLSYLRGGRQAAARSGTLSLTKTLIELDKLVDQSQDQMYRWPRRQQLALVVHFIKEPWVSSPKSVGGYRYFGLRKKLDQQMAQLRITLRDHPRLYRWVRGIDGAANELHAPPDVFAPLFRQAERAGLTRRTFHVGEDYPHLLTGIRHMLDAVELLNLNNGARIGHGTAMGIKPSLWLGRMPGILQVRRGEVLLDLLCAWRMLRELSDQQSASYQVEIRLKHLLPQVFMRSVSPELFERAMKLRGLHLGFVARFMSLSNSARAHMRSKDLATSAPWRTSSYSDSLREEERMVADAANYDREAFELHWAWQSDKSLWERSEKLIPVETQDSLFTPELYLRLQQTLMAKIANRRVVIETLPSSNVRISQYERFEEHHSLRWMGIPGHRSEGDTPIMVSLGSDDPGIFAGNLVGEIYQLYAVLRKAGLSDCEAVERISEINERGRQYRFHDPSL